jgi:hypothetical protein
LVWAAAVSGALHVMISAACIRYLGTGLTSCPESRRLVEREGEMDQGWVAVDACMLPTMDRPLRVAEFDALFAGHLASVEASADRRAQMVLEGPVGLRGKVQDLADRETRCCSFFSFTVSSVGDAPGHESVTLDVEVPESRTDVLSALVARARARSTVGSA